MIEHPRVRNYRLIFLLKNINYFKYVSSAKAEYFTLNNVATTSHIFTITLN